MIFKLFKDLLRKIISLSLKLLDLDLFLIFLLDVLCLLLLRFSKDLIDYFYFLLKYPLSIRDCFFFRIEHSPSLQSKIILYFLP
jgi:hypothetical protein